MSYLSQPEKHQPITSNKKAELVQTGFQWPLQSQSPIHASWIAMIALTIASLLGLIAPQLFHFTELTHPLRSISLFNLLILVPLLFFANLKSRQGSVRWTLIMFGTLYYCLHLSSAFLLQLHANPCSVLMGIAVVAAACSLVWGLISLDFSYVAVRFRRNTPHKTIALLLAFSILPLIATELVKAMDSVMGTAHREIISASLVLNLLIVLPLVLSAVTLLWRKQEAGFALALLISIKLALTGIIFALGLYFKDATRLAEGIKLEWPAYVIMALAGIVGSVLLLSKIRTISER
jgi:hypothetical protein